MNRKYLETYENLKRFSLEKIAESCMNNLLFVRETLTKADIEDSQAILLCFGFLISFCDEEKKFNDRELQLFKLLTGNKITKDEAENYFGRMMTDDVLKNLKNLCKVSSEIRDNFAGIALSVFAVNHNINENQKALFDFIFEE